MCPRASLALAILTCAATLAAAQTPNASARDREQQALEATLEELDSPALTASYLRRRLDHATGDERTVLARRLAEVYVELLRTEQDPQRLEALERQARHLADGLPEVAAAPLRIDLLRARYARAQEIAERWRLRLATPEERRAAQNALAEIAGVLSDLGGRLHRRVDALEREERRGRTEDEALLREALQDARRQRSLAFYYAGWSNYYRALLSGSPRQTDEALRQLGWLLNAEGAPAVVERTPKALFRFEHVARAALGVALVEALRGEAARAVRWLDAVESADQLAENVGDQLFTTRLVVLATGDRWADLVTHTNLRRRETDAPLTASEARLLAVLALEREREGVETPGLEEILQTLAQVALADLVEAGQIGHVLDLVERFGTLPLGDQGFIVRYVRALRSYNAAREAHLVGATPQDREAPATSDAQINAYRRAADLFLASQNASDAGTYTDQRARAGVLRGLALYFAGDLEGAADVLEGAGGAGDAKSAEEALWFAIVALDRAIDGGRPSLTDRLDRLALVYLERFPTGERAARLLLLRAGAGLVDPERAVDVLLSIEREEPIYPTALREAGRLLQRLYRGSTGSRRERVGARFVEVAEELIELDAQGAASLDDRAARDAAQRAILFTRQMLEVLLSTPSPDVARARRAIDDLEKLAADAGVSLDDAGAELAYRRLQIALATRAAGEIEQQLAILRRSDTPYAEAADRLLFQDAVRRQREAPSDIERARAVVRFGLRLANANAQGRAAESVQEAVAAAAARLYDHEDDTTFLEIARTLDAGRIASGVATESVLRRHARLSAAIDDHETALDAWRRLLAALPRQTDAWYEARVESLELLVILDPARAGEVLAQHRLLYPELGPEPWGDRLVAIERRLGVAGEAR